MNAFERKNINFFKITPCLDGTKNKLIAVASEISSYCWNDSLSVFCDNVGYVHIFKSCEKLLTFRASGLSIQKCAITREYNLLALVTPFDDVSGVSLQVYDLYDTESSKIVSPKCVNRFHWNLKKNICSLQILVKDENLMVALGCENGDLLIHRGLLRDTSMNFSCFSISSTAIRNIEFDKNNAMFICTDGEIYCYAPIENIYVGKKVILDIKNSNSGCCSVLQTTGSNDPYFLVGRKDAVYCFTSDGRGPCYAVDGKKKCIVCYKNYLAMLISTELSSASATLTIIDLENNFMAMQKHINNALGLFTSGTNCYVISSKTELFVLEECNLKKKIQILLKKNLYDIAFRLIETSTCSEEIAADVYMKYGDYLMSKNKLELAVDNYIKTIGFVNPYLIIRKLLNLRYNKILFDYMQALIDSGHAQARHIQLLLKCNERHDLSSNIDTYIKDGIIFGSPEYCLVKSKENISQTLTNLSFSSYLKIIDNDKLSLEFVSKMEQQNIYKFISENGKFLFTNYPQKTLNILKQLYTNSLLKSSPEHITPLLLQHDNICKDFLEHIDCHKSYSNISLFNLLFEFYLREWYSKKLPEKKVNEFFTHNHASELHLLLVGKSYGFLPNSEYFYKFSLRNKFYMQYFSHKLMESVIDMKTNNLFKFTGSFLDEKISTSNPYLGIAQTFCKNKKLLITDTKDKFNSQKLYRPNYHQNLKVLTKGLFENHCISDILLNFLVSPIEFRSNLCSICRQEIRLPAIYFLCKHVYHRDCLNSRSRKEICVICMNSVLEITNFNPSESRYREENTDVSRQISGSFAEGLIKSTIQRYFKTSFVAKNLYCKARMTIPHKLQRDYVAKNPFEESNECCTDEHNPFNEYDTNLNPFE